MNTARLTITLLSLWSLSLCMSSHRGASPWVAAAWADDSVFDDTRGDVSINQEALDRAEELFFKGLTAYQAKRYQDAAKHFLDAHNLVPFRDLLFNIARSYEGLKNKEEAIRYYKLYIKTKPIDETLIIQRVRELGDVNFRRAQRSIRVNPHDNSNPTLSPTPSLEASSPLPREPLTWSTLGGGAALVAMSLYFGMDALNQAESARAASTPKAYEDFKEAAEGSALITDISLTVGLVAIAGGVFLWLNERPAEPAVLHRDLKITQSAPKPSLHWSVNVDRDFTALGVSGSF